MIYIAYIELLKHLQRHFSQVPSQKESDEISLTKERA